MAERKFLNLEGLQAYDGKIKEFIASEDAKVNESVANLAELVGAIPEGYEATTIAAYAKELADNVAANGYDDTALANRVSKNESDIVALHGKDTELAAKDVELQAAIDAVKEDVDAFFKDADMTESAKDTLKELQSYIASDETAASQMAASIKANSDAIAAIKDGTNLDSFADVEGAIAVVDELIGEVPEDKTVVQMIADAQTAAEGHADGLNTAMNARVEALEAVDHEHTNKELIDTYTQTEADLADAVAKKHEHANAAELDLIVSGDKAKWDAAEAKAHEHANADVLAGISAEKVAAWDNAEGNANAYTDSQRLGYIEPAKVFTYDGREDAEFTEFYGLRFAHLSNDVFDLTKIKKIKCVFANNGQEVEFGDGDFTLENIGEGIIAARVSLGTQSSRVLIAPPAGGLWGCAQEGIGYLYYVEFDETIHPIDPKYLPDTVHEAITTVEDIITDVNALKAVSYVEITTDEIDAMFATEA